MKLEENQKMMLTSVYFRKDSIFSRQLRCLAIALTCYFVWIFVSYY